MASDSQKVASELQALLDASPDAVLLVDRSGTIAVLNHRAEAMFAAATGQLRGKPIETLLPERLRERHASARAAYAAAPTVRAMSARSGLVGLRSDGTEFPVEISLTPVIGSAEGLVMAVVHEAVFPARIEEAIARTDQAVGALDAIPDAVLTTDADGNIDFMNRSAEALTGRTRDSARGRPLSEVLPLTSESSGEPLESPVAGCLRSGTSGGTCEAMLHASPGQEGRALDLSTSPIRDPSGAIIGAAVVARDVTHARAIARQLSHQATHDPLTGLVNRSEFERRLARALASAAERHGEHALCFLDLDGFKRVNDACGHLAGDELLRQLSDLMLERMRSRDTLARLGGDEFGMLLEHCRLPTAERIADEIRKAIAAYRFAFGEESYSVEASIGIVPIRTGIRRSSDVLRAADTACYLAKRGGGNRIQLYAPRQRAADTREDHEWARRVLRAVEEDRFRLYAQPVVPLDHGEGRWPRFELLLRLVDEGGEPLSPGAFLPAARRNGLMPSIDRWVIKQAIRQLSEWRQAHPGVEPPAVAINLADETVTGGDAMELVHEALAGAEVQPRALCFEIGESAVVANPAASAHLLRRLHVAGCQTTLEHCGSGMAAFTVLRRLQLDYLKIAGHIVRGLARDPIDRALATALNEVGHVLGLRTIGVQVERPEVLACLRRIGVDGAQGFDIGRPEPFDDAIGRLGVLVAS